MVKTDEPFVMMDMAIMQIYDRLSEHRKALLRDMLAETLHGADFGYIRWFVHPAWVNQTS